MLRDQTYRWLIVAYTIVLQAVTLGGIIYSFALFAPPWLAVFEADRAEVMLTISLLQLSFGVFSPFVGALMDRVRMRSVVLFGCGCYGLGWWAVSQATQLWHVWAIYLLIFPVAMTTMGTLASQTLVTRWFTEKRGVAIGFSAVGTNVGGVVVPLLIAPALAGGAWREVAWWLLAGGLATVVPLTWIMLARRSPGEQTVASASAPVSAADVLRNRVFWVAAAALLPLNLTFGAVQFNLGVLSADLGFAEQSGFVVALCSSCMILGKLLFGALGDRLDHRVLYWIAVSVMIASMMVLQGQPGWVVLLFGVVLVGLSGGSLLPMMGIIVSARFDVSSFGRAMGLLMLTLAFASLGPLAAGWIYDRTGSYDLAFQLLAGWMMIGALAMWWLPPPGSRVP